MLTPAEKIIASRTVYGEARGETLEGKVAVARVILNRAAKPSWWGHGVESVCLKPYQFSCWNADNPNLKVIAKVLPHDPVYLECLRAVEIAADPDLPDITNGADHYFSDSIPAPDWEEGRAPVARIGGHIFYRLGDA